MWTMSEADVPDARESHNPGVRGLVERLSEHHRDAVRRRGEQELARDVEDAAFDLGADTAHPVAGHSAAGFDVEADVGRDNEPPELRS